MRVYLVGSHNVGKTTLSRWISETYNLPMITEVARTVLSELELSLDRLRYDLKAVTEYQRQVFTRQIQAEKGQEHFVSDRAFDALAYTAEHALGFSKILESSACQEYMKRVASGTVFFVRPHLEILRSDGVRESPVWEGVVRIDGMIKLLLEMYNIPYMPIASLSMQERVRAVQVVLGPSKNPLPC
jgi:hypothetical protein